MKPSADGKDRSVFLSAMIINQTIGGSGIRYLFGGLSSRMQWGGGN
jgi:hypothetical protein